jgi:phosphate transport system substrate-binding protein
MQRSHKLVSLITIALLAACNAVCAGPLRVGGTGSAMETMRFLGARFAATDETQFEVVPSLGSNGGLRALEAGLLDIVVSGRKLNDSEVAKGLAVLAAVRSPWGLATSHTRPNGVWSASVAAIFLDPEASWADGTPIRVILRPKADSENQTLTESFPGMGATLEQLRTRRDLPIAATDQDNADMAERVPGSLVSITYTQLTMERRKLRQVAIDRVEPTFENFASGSYRFGRTLYLVTTAASHPAALRFVAFLNSAAGQQALRETGNLLVPR